ncbi:MAG: site-specific DNA-methyltransferase [Syntrophaceae bacterium CG2_30_58_14]|nr:MAG: site-specific DNA-methyltransferase [Syntrophaceae bacterium CG2_30_58_14]
MARQKRANANRESHPYKHPEADSPMRPDVGTQAQFRKKKPPATYRYDSSLSPALDWDGGNAAREAGEAFIRQIVDAENLEEAKTAAERLKAISRPFLNWTGKAERLSFDCPTLPLFIHERLSTKAIIETLQAHRRDKQVDMFDLFGDPRHSVADQILRAYEHRDKWVNRMVLGDSLIVMNSLLQYEGLGGQVQMLFADFPYGVKFGSNFQPFVRKRDVKHNEDEDMTREPEMVKAYRDTWELGLHSYLTYLRDRLLLCRDLLHPTGSIFVQISDENLHHVREILDEVFGAENFVAQIAFQTTSGFETTTIATLGDFLIWYARDKDNVKVRKLYQEQPAILGEGNARWVLLPDTTYRGVSVAEKTGLVSLPEGARLYKPDNLISQGASGQPQSFEFEGRVYTPGGNSHWKANYPLGMERLAAAGRIHKASNSIQYRRYADDFPFTEIGNLWTDTLTGSFTDDKLYIVQTNLKVVERCLLMTADPGDLVLDITGGSGTTAYVAEQWGRRWISVDVSRVPVALAKQRLLTATFSYYRLKDEKRGPAGGFVYERRQNKKGEEVGGIVPHMTLKSIANDEPPEEVVLVDRPEVETRITRITGPFTLEATIPTPVEMEADSLDVDAAAHSGASSTVQESEGAFVDRMLEVLRKSPVLHLGGGRTVILKNVRPPAKTLSLSAEALVDAAATGRTPSLADVIQEAEEKSGTALPLSQQAVALVFGPENGAVSEKLVFEAAREAYVKQYVHLYVIGFAVQAHARELIDKCADAVGIPATYIQATPDLMMGDLLKNMRSSQIFSVCGMPEVRLTRSKAAEKGGADSYAAELLGMDVFDPVTMEVDHRRGDDVPAWLLDTDYNDLCFHVCQAFFPRTGAWENIKRALKGTYEETVWDHLAGTKSAPFSAGECGKIAVKVIDDRGNELLVVKDLKEAEG